MKGWIELISWMAGMFFKTLVAVATLYTISINAPSFEKISLIAGIASVIWIIDIPFLMEHFSKEKEKE